MNLISSKWIPVRRRSGVADLIAPSQIAESPDPPVSLRWPRSDWNVAGYEFLIGLLYAACPPANSIEWEERAEDLNNESISAALAPFEPWFELTGASGRRAFQAFEEVEGLDLPLSRLMIDAPGANTEKKNSDLFVKRLDYPPMAPEVAAIALIAFQNFALSGGSGHRTSLRGGGPMTTLVIPSPSATLFDTVWANVPDGVPWPHDRDVGELLPWSRPTQTSEAKGSTIHEPEWHDESPHPACFFGTPRRISLVMASEPARCPYSNRVSDTPIVGFRMIKYGHDYGIWRHPCTPYYVTKPGEPALPVHPKPVRFGYRHYAGTLIRKEADDSRIPAACVREYANRRDPREKSPVRILVAGWATANMTAVNYVESLHPLPSWKNPGTENRVVDAIEAAEIIARALAYQAKNALSLAELDKGRPANLREKFYSETESEFERLLIDIDTTEPQRPLLHWYNHLTHVAQHLFLSETEPFLAACEPARIKAIADSNRNLNATLKGFSKDGRNLFGLLLINPPPPTKKNPNNKVKK